MGSKIIYNSMKKLLLTFLTIWLSCFALNAQTQERPFALGLWGGLTQYNGDLGNGFYDMSQTQFGHVGLNAAWYVNPHFDFVINGTYGNIGYTENQFKSFHGEQLQLNFHFNLNLLNSDKHKVIPYLLGGIGVADYPKKYQIVDGFDFFAAFGGGVRVKLSDRINLHLQESFAYSDHDNRDGEARNTNDAFLMHSVGITYSFSVGKDTDKDGVKDKRDNCPNTPLGVIVNESGCPLDRDGDGIADYLDACPDVKGTIAMKGCPDRDNDLVVDSLDKCPDFAGLVALMGCPDKDGDGVTDAIDKCPDVFGTKELEGCPVVDSDMDGVLDTEDACPAEKGLVATKGCPDKDADGIADKDDKCPDVFGIAMYQGCPDDNNETNPTTSIPVGEYQNIQFETGKDQLTAGSKRILNTVAKLMKENVGYHTAIEGHTDNIGSQAMNNILSQSRAEIVKYYLINKGIDGSRLSTKGFGDKNPIAPNKTSQGRAKNRRVEFKVAK